MKQYPNVRIIYGRRNKNEKNIEKSVEIEISFQKRRKWISTGIRVLPKNWKDKQHIVGRADAIDLNMQIDSRYNSINKYIRCLIANEQEFTWSKFEDHLEWHNEDGSFIEFVEKRIEERKKTKTPNTIKNYNVFLRTLKEYGKITTFSDLKKKEILKFEEWLRGRFDYSQAGIFNYHKNMKVFIKDAMLLDLLPENPYNGLKIDKGKPSGRKFLTLEELSKIEKADVGKLPLMRTRDLFVFQCYTGLAYADLCKFDFTKAIKKGDKYVVHDIRQKSGEDFYIVILSKALEILKKYDFSLPIISNQKYNAALKNLAALAGLNKSLTSHMARHTYATICLNMGVSMEVLAKMLGHTNIKTTHIYAKIVNETIEKAYDGLERSIAEQAQNIN